MENDIKERKHKSPLSLKGVGITAILASLLYILSDLLELIQGGFSTIQLVITYIAFLAIPYFILGIYIVQDEKAGLMGLIGSILYGVSFIFYAFTVMYAIVEKINNYSVLIDALGIFYYTHGAILLLATVLIGITFLKEKIFARWEGFLLILSVVVSIVILVIGFSDEFQIFPSTLRNIAFIGVGYQLMKEAS